MWWGHDFYTDLKGWWRHMKVGSRTVTAVLGEHRVVFLMTVKRVSWWGVYESGEPKGNSQIYNFFSNVFVTKDGAMTVF